MQIVEHGCFIILGQTESGKTFRPSDWDQRLCCTLSHFTAGKLEYDSMVVPILHNNVSSVWVAGKLEVLNRPAWTFLLNFAKDNKLKIVWPDICILPDKNN